MAKHLGDLLRQDDMLEEEIEAVLELTSSYPWKIVSQYLKRLHDEALLVCEDPPNLTERQLGQIQGKAKNLRFLIYGLETEARQLLNAGR